VDLVVNPNKPADPPADSGIWDGPSSSMYRPDCGPVRGLSGMRCLSLVGILFTIVFTYAGFGLVIAGVPIPSSVRRSPTSSVFVCLSVRIRGASSVRRSPMSSVSVCLSDGSQRRRVGRGPRVRRRRGLSVCLSAFEGPVRASQAWSGRRSCTSRCASRGEASGGRARAPRWRPAAASASPQRRRAMARPARECRAEEETRAPLASHCDAPSLGQALGAGLHARVVPGYGLMCVRRRRGCFALGAVGEEQTTAAHWGDVA
jgi:hypothetical protein